jgi:hypothetical protein
MNYKLFITSLPFIFLSGKDLVEFLEILFTNCIEKNKLYESIIDWNTTLLFQSCFNGSIPERDQIKIVNALELVEEHYGNIHDPEKILFSSMNKIKFN